MRILTILSYLFCLGISFNGNSQTITVQNLDDSGVGSLRDAISNANSGDTIRFNPMLIAQGSDTLVLDTVISIDKDLVIKGIYDSEDTLFLTCINNQMFFLIESIELSMDSMIFTSAYYNYSNTYFLYLRNSEVNILNSKFLDFSETVLSSEQSNLTINNSSFFCDSLYSHYPLVYLTQGDTLRKLKIIKSKFLIKEKNTVGIVVRTAGNKENNKVIIQDSYFENFETLIYGHNTIDIQYSTFNNSLIKTGEPYVGFAYIRDITLTVKSSTFAITDSNQVQNTILCIGTPYGPIEPVPLDTLKLNFTNCTFNGGLYEDTLYGNFTDSNYLDYFGPDLDELKITSCIFNDINGFNELPIDSSGGYNLFSFPQSIGLDSTDQANVLVSDINLGPLQNNGGYTPTHLPNYQSLAFNSGNPNDTISAQNGAIIQRRDIGSAEIQAILTVDTTEYCGEFYDWRGQMLTESAIYSDIEVSTTGLDSVFAIDLTLEYLDALAISDGGELTANSSDATYQWMDCSTYLPLFGETNQTLTPSIAGTYAVVVSNGICTDTSACVFIDNLSVEEQEEYYVFIKDNVLHLNGISSIKIDYIIYNSLGQKVLHSNTSQEKQDLSYLESGVYYIRLISDKVNDKKYNKFIIK